jgi:hypothetical protein
MPSFREATDRLIADPPSYHLRSLADRMGVVLNTVNRARMEGPHARNPPAGWEAHITAESRDHADALEAKARDLRALADELSD